MYCILERTPFPGNFAPLATCWIQDAEFRLNMNRRFFYERAIVWRLLMLYRFEDAKAIVDYRQAVAPYAEHLLLKVQFPLT